MVTDAEQAARDEKQAGRADVRVTLIEQEKAENSSVVGWVRHHRPERARVEGEPVLSQEE